MAAERFSGAGVPFGCHRRAPSCVGRSAMPSSPLSAGPKRACSRLLLQLTLSLGQRDRANLLSGNRYMEQRLSIDKIDTLVVGGGQAGLAMSEHLSANGVPHLVLERYRIAELWRSERWDSLVANGPAWHDRFPGLEFSDVGQSVGPNDFPPKETVADYFVAYAKKISAPIRCGVE